MDRLPLTWLQLRIALVVLSAPAWLAIRAAMQDDFSTPPSWHFPIILIGFSGFFVLFLSVLRADMEWVAPSWHHSPLDNHRPLEGLHLSACSFLAGALALLVVGILREPTDWAWVLPASVGLGLLVGVRLASIPEARNGT